MLCATDGKSKYTVGEHKVPHADRLGSSVFGIFTSGAVFVNTNKTSNFILKKKYK